MADRPRRRRSDLALAGLATAGIAMLAGLGTWQLDRLQWKTALIAERRAALAAPAVELARPADASAVPDYRRVRLHGLFRHDKELLVGPRTRRGTAGWHVVTPLAVAGQGFVLVDRGFVPETFKRAETRAAGQIGGPVTVEGMLRRPAAPGAFQPANDPGRGAWFRIDPPAMAAALGLSGIAPFWVAADDTPNPGGWPAGGAEAVMPPNNHLQYALTWYALAAALLVVYLLFRRRQARGG